MVKNNKNKPVTFELLTEFYAEFLKPQFERLEKALKDIRGDIQQIKADMRFMKDDLNGVKGELSNTVSRKEFHQLKSDVRNLQAQ